jgi:hypothetical protein
MSRYAIHQKDRNEDQLRAYLEAHGAVVEKIQSPVDWLVEYRGVVAVAEVKMPGGKLRPIQDAFLRRWRGPWAILISEVDCRWLLSVMTPQKPQRLAWGELPKAMTPPRYDAEFFTALNDIESD